MATAAIPAITIPAIAPPFRPVLLPLLSAEGVVVAEEAGVVVASKAPFVEVVDEELLTWEVDEVVVLFVEDDDLELVELLDSP